MNTPIEFESAQPCCCRAGARTTIRVNRGSEFVPCDLDIGAWKKGVVLDSSRRTTASSNPSTASLEAKA
jgi:hypothetical protein